MTARNSGVAAPTSRGATAETVPAAARAAGTTQHQGIEAAVPNAVIRRDRADALLTGALMSLQRASLNTTSITSS